MNDSERYEDLVGSNVVPLRKEHDPTTPITGAKVFRDPDNPICELCADRGVFDTGDGTYRDCDCKETPQ
jgi:hypothetical protein